MQVGAVDDDALLDAGGDLAVEFCQLLQGCLGFDALGNVAQGQAEQLGTIGLLQFLGIDMVPAGGILRLEQPEVEAHAPAPSSALQQVGPEGLLVPGIDTGLEGLAKKGAPLGAQHPAKGQVHFAKPAPGVQRGIAHGGPIVEPEVAVPGGLQLQLGLPQLLVLQLQFHLMDQQLMKQALGLLLPQPSVGGRGILCRQLCLGTPS